MSIEFIKFSQGVPFAFEEAVQREVVTARLSEEARGGRVKAELLSAGEYSITVTGKDVAITPTSGRRKGDYLNSLVVHEDGDATLRSVAQSADSSYMEFSPLDKQGVMVLGFSEHGGFSNEAADRMRAANALRRGGRVSQISQGTYVYADLNQDGTGIVVHALIQYKPGKNP